MGKCIELWQTENYEPVEYLHNSVEFIYVSIDGSWTRWKTLCLIDFCMHVYDL